MAINYNQYPSSPTGINYLVGEVMPWHDYVVFRSNEDVSVCIYGMQNTDGVWERATVRTVERGGNNYNYQYITNQYTETNVTADILYPYYAYGNVIGVNYNLPSYNYITSVCILSAFALTALISVFRLIFSLKRFKK